MQVGIHYMNFTLPGGPEAMAPTLAATAKAAEAGGFTRFTMMDHYFQMEQFRTAHDPMLEGYTALGYVAAHTEKMSLGLLVTGVTYRHPGLLAKIVDDARHPVRRSRVPRSRRRLVRARAPGARSPVPAGRGAVRAARGDAADLPADVERRRGPVRRQALPAGRDHLRTRSRSSSRTRRS